MTPHEFTKSGKHLPKILQDFHDTKDIFKAMHNMYESHKDENYNKMPNWIDGQCYTIDWFLWFMAQRGYTLQRCKRKDVTFYDIHEDIQNYNNNTNFADLINQSFNICKGGCIYSKSMNQPYPRKCTVCGHVEAKSI